MASYKCDIKKETPFSEDIKICVDNKLVLKEEDNFCTFEDTKCHVNVTEEKIDMPSYKCNIRKETPFSEDIKICVDNKLVLKEDNFCTFEDTKCHINVTEEKIDMPSYKCNIRKETPFSEDINICVDKKLVLKEKDNFCTFEDTKCHINVTEEKIDMSSYKCDIKKETPFSEDIKICVDNKLVLKEEDNFCTFEDTKCHINVTEEKIDMPSYKCNIRKETPFSEDIKICVDNKLVLKEEDNFCTFEDTKCHINVTEEKIDMSSYKCDIKKENPFSEDINICVDNKVVVKGEEDNQFMFDDTKFYDNFTEEKLEMSTYECDVKEEDIKECVNDKFVFSKEDQYLKVEDTKFSVYITEHEMITSSHDADFYLASYSEDCPASSITREESNEEIEEIPMSGGKEDNVYNKKSSQPSNMKNDENIRKCNLGSQNTKFVCGICDKKFSSTAKSFIIHAEKEERKKCKNKNFECRECHKIFLYEDWLRNHVYIMHQKKCYVCYSKVSSINELLTHIVTEHKEGICIRYECYECHQMFNSSYSHESHINILRKEYECDECHKTFTSLVSLKVHISKLHKTYECDECYKTFTSSGYLELHRNTVHVSHVCRICYKRFSSSCAVKNHINFTHHKTNLICNKCHLKFSSVEKMRSHFDLKHVNKCQLCRTNFPSEMKLQVHIMNTHKDSKNHECLICRQKFRTFRILQFHTNSVHKGLKRYSCGACPRWFADLSNLKIHITNAHVSKIYGFSKKTERNELRHSEP